MISKVVFLTIQLKKIWGLKISFKISFYEKFKIFFSYFSWLSIFVTRLILTVQPNPPKKIYKSKSLDFL